MTEHSYAFPVKIIRKIIAEESEELLRELFKTPISFPDELRGMIRDHKEHFAALSSYEELDNWLRIYRDISLKDWVESL